VNCGGVDLKHRPLGYEPKDISTFNNLQDAPKSLVGSLKDSLLDS
jgi:hypothetical protein